MARSRHTAPDPSPAGDETQSPRSRGELGAEALTLTLSWDQLELLRGLVAKLVALEQLQREPNDRLH
jgi:hypothetical protein